MKRSSDPVRLADLPDEQSFDFGNAIRAIRAQEPTAVEIAALGRRLSPQLVAPTAMGTAGMALLLWAKWGLSLLVAFGAGFYGVAWFAHQKSARARPTHTAAVQAPAAETARVQPTPVAAAAPQAAVQAPLATTAKHQRPRAEQPAAPAVPSRRPEAELALLQRAQAALDHEPAAALALAARHARDYPSGLFAQEREILAIEALLKLKQKSSALARAQEFVQRYPDSPHARRVRALIDRSPSSTTEAIAPAAGHSVEGTGR